MRDVQLYLEFATVAEELSFTRAARRLGVSQPWLSTRIRKLEDQFAMPLFERTTRAVRLTHAGEQLLEHVGPLARLAEITFRETERMRLGQAGRLRIGSPQLGAPDRRQSVLFSRFSAANPDVTLEVEPGSADVHLELLRRGTLDLVLAPLPVDEREFESASLFKLCVAVMLAPGDPLRQLPSLPPSAFAGRRVATFSRHRAPEFFDRIYGPFVAAGAELVRVPELRANLLSSEPKLVVSTIVPPPGDAVLGHGVVRRAVDSVAPIWLKLVRRRAPVHSRAGRLFWSFALGASGPDNQDTATAP